MKRFLMILCGCVLLVQLAGCGQTVSEQQGEEYINITNPTMNGTEANKNTAADIYPGTEVIDGYLVYPLEGLEYKAAQPDWRPEQADTLEPIDIDYMYTKVGDSRIKIFAEAHMPQGTKLERRQNGIFWYNQAAPDFLWDTYTETIKESILSHEQQYIRYAWESSNDYKESSGLTYVINPAEVECISCALYEGFYQDMPKLHITLYGITEEVFEQALELKQNEPLPGQNQNADDKFRESYYMDYTALYDKYQAGGCALDVLLDTDITQSGNYYVDYKMLQADKAYKQMMYVITYDHESQNPDWAFSIWAIWYNIEDEAQYQQWKEQHSAEYLK